MTTGDKIRRARLAAGLSQVEAAKRAKTTQSHLSAVECNRKMPRLVTIKALAAIFNVPPGDLI